MNNIARANYYIQLLNQLDFSFNEKFIVTLANIPNVATDFYPKAYRYIVLQPGIDDDPHSKNEVQFDLSRLTAPNTSWSKTREACNKFLMSREHGFIILLEASIEGFLVVDLANTIILEAELFSKQKLTPIGHSLVEALGLANEIDLLCCRVRNHIKVYGNEDEIVSTKIIEWHILDSFEN